MIDIEGVWTGEFKSNVMNIGRWVEVILLRDGKLYGGNSNFYFIGNYTLEGERIEGTLESTYYGLEPLSVFGLADTEKASVADITGTVAPDRMEIDILPTGQPSLRGQGVFLRRAGREVF